MNNNTKNILKMAVMFAVIGAVMAVAMPYAMGALGFEAVTVGAYGIASQSLLFAGFGAFSTALTPIFDKMFGVNQPTSPVDTSVAASANQHSVEPSVAKAPTVASDVPIPMTGFVSNLNQERAANAQDQSNQQTR